MVQARHLLAACEVASLNPVFLVVVSMGQVYVVHHCVHFPPRKSSPYLRSPFEASDYILSSSVDGDALNSVYLPIGSFVYFDLRIFANRISEKWGRKGRQHAAVFAELAASRVQPGGTVSHEATGASVSQSRGGK